MKRRSTPRTSRRAPAFGLSKGRQTAPLRSPLIALRRNARTTTRTYSTERLRLPLAYAVWRPSRGGVTSRHSSVLPARCLFHTTPIQISNSTALRPALSSRRVPESAAPMASARPLAFVSVTVAGRGARATRPPVLMTAGRSLAEVYVIHTPSSAPVARALLARPAM